MPWLFLRGVLIGLAAAAPIGPVNVEIARRTLRGGYASGVALGAGAVSVDVAYALLTTLSVGRFLNRPAVAVPLAVGSVIILSYLGFLCLRGAFRPKPPIVTTAGDDVRPPSPTIDYEVPPPPTAPRPRNGYLAGVLMTAVNPMTLAFWFTTLPSVAGPIEARRLPLIAAGVFAGTFAWVLCFAAALAWLGRFGNGLWLRVVDGVGGATLIAFALSTFLRSIRPLL